jgi:hypothetical protein
MKRKKQSSAGRQKERKKGGRKSEILLFPSNLVIFCYGRSWIPETLKGPRKSVRIFIISR